MISSSQLSLMLRAFGAKVTFEGSYFPIRNYLVAHPSEEIFAELEDLVDKKLASRGPENFEGKVTFFFTEDAAGFLNIKFKGKNR